MKAVALWLGGGKDGEPELEKELRLRNSEGNVCLEKPGQWLLTLQPQGLKFEQHVFTLDMKVPNLVDIVPTHFMLSGQLRFQSEDTIEGEIDDIGFRVNGEDFWEIEDISDVEFEPLFRQFQVWIPYRIFEASNNIEVEPLTKRGADSKIFFKPATRSFTIEKEKIHQDTGAHFKVLEGMLVEGQTQPAVEGATVTIQRENQVSIKDRTPTTISTDKNGKYRHGPVDIDTYYVEIAKSDYTFTRIGDSNDFKASMVAGLEIVATDAQGVALTDAFVTVSAGKTILKGQTDSEGKLKFSAVTPQSYFLTAIKKEYSFNGGQTLSLQVAEEEHKVLSLVGERVAFSVYGHVTTLLGQPVTEGVVISRHGDREEQGKIQPDGSYRVMGMRPGLPYTFTVESSQIVRTLPGAKTVTIAQPTQSDPNPDVADLRFASIERPSQLSIAGSAFFEGEESVKQHKMLYKEKPQLTVSVHVKDQTSALKTMKLPESHLFEFNGLASGTDYELVIKSNKLMVDRRHEAVVTVPVDAVDDFDTFVKVIMPLRGKEQSTE